MLPTVLVTRTANVLSGSLQYWFLASFLSISGQQSSSLYKGENQGDQLRYSANRWSGRQRASERKKRRLTSVPVEMILYQPIKKSTVLSKNRFDLHLHLLLLICY